MNNYITINDFLVSLLEYNPQLCYGENRFTELTAIYNKFTAIYPISTAAEALLAENNQLEPPPKTNRCISLKFDNAGKNFLLDLYCYSENKVMVGFNYDYDSTQQIKYVTAVSEIEPFLEAFYSLYEVQSKEKNYYVYSGQGKETFPTNELEEAYETFKLLLKQEPIPDSFLNPVITYNKIKLTKANTVFTLYLEQGDINKDLDNTLFDRLKFPVVVEKNTEILTKGNLTIPLYELGHYPLLKSIKIKPNLVEMPQEGYTEIKEWFEAIASIPTLEPSQIKSIVNYHLINSKLPSTVKSPKKGKI